MLLLQEIALLGTSVPLEPKLQPLPQSPPKEDNDALLATIAKQALPLQFFALLEPTTTSTAPRVWLDATIALQDSIAKEQEIHK